MVRWSYVVPRLLIVLAIFLFLHFGLSPMLRWSVVTVAQRATGARVDLDWLSAAPVRGELKLSGFAMANPRAPKKNLLQFDRAHLQLDNNALLRRRLVITEGRLEQLEFGRRRDDSGRLSEEDSPAGKANRWGQRLQRLGKSWLSGVGERVQSDLEKDFHSILLARQLRQRWAAEYQLLRQKADRWEERVRQLRAVADNPQQGLRNLEDIQRFATDVSSTLQEMYQMRDELQRLSNQLQSDQLAVDEARRHDALVIQERLQVGALDSEKLTHYLLGPEVERQLDMYLPWLSRTQRAVTLIGGKLIVNHAGGRGRDMPFGTRNEPDLLVHRLLLSGDLGREDQPLPFRGTARNLTPQPDRWDEPAEIKLQSTGRTPWIAVARLDRRQQPARDQIRMHCPALPLPKLRLGDPDQLALNVADAKARMWVELELVDGTIDGRIIIDQPQPQLQAVVGASLGGAQLQRRMEQALSSVESIQTTVFLSGKLSDPTAKLQSNLGAQLSAGVNQALSAELADRRQQLIDHADRLVDQELRQLYQLTSDQQRMLLNRWSVGQRHLEDLRHRFIPGGKLPASLNRLLR